MIIGRTREKRDLQNVIDSDKSEFVAVFGRRRVGKTFLVRETCRYRFAFEHTGLKNFTMTADGEQMPVRDAMKRQLREFHRSLQRYGCKKRAVPKDWYAAFHLLEDVLEEQEPGRKVVFLDECPWMDTPRSEFLGALDHFWNGWCTMRKDIVLIICGSAASWILNKIEGDVGGLHNRVTRHVYLRPFSLCECEEFVRAKGLVMTRKQIVEGYMVFGGIPYYWDVLSPDMSLAQNVDHLLFSGRGELANEYENLYASLFRKPAPYVSIIRALGTRRRGLTREEIGRLTGLPLNGDLTEMLKVLEQCDFIRTYATPGKVSRGRLYQLIDNFTLFYFKFVEGRAGRTPDFWTASQSSQSVRSWCGFAYERVALLHVEEIKRALGISGVVTRVYGWNYEAESEDDEGGQIDLVIERDDRVTNLCEVKFRKGLFAIDDDYALKLQTRRERYIEETGTGDAVHLTMITTEGIVRNAHRNDVQSEVILDDLFRA